MAPETKQKLTLTVDAETVDAAHKLGLNISEVTERVLRGYTFDPKGLERGATAEQYQELLRTMDPLLEKFGCRIIVGSRWGGYSDEDPVYYSNDGLHVEEPTGDDEDSYTAAGISIDEVKFLKPNQILRNFFAAIESVKTRRREEVESLILAKKFIEALTEQELKRATAGQSSSAVERGEE
jgi:hypothetical protein